MRNITFFIHLYYPGSWERIQQQCGSVFKDAAKLIITACHDDVIDEIDHPDNAIILKVPNQGKDIGGKLAAFSYYLHFCKRTEYIAFLHDKISPQTINADYWFGQLFSIFGEKTYMKILRTLDKDPATGILGSKIFLKNEWIRSKKEFDTTNNDLLRQLIHTYHLNCKSYDFIAGTIFIGRSRIFEKFFSSHSALEARKQLEKGNVLDLEQGTYTHAWERLLCFIAEDQGYKIAGA